MRPTVVTGLIGALVTSRYKWGYFAFGKQLIEDTIIHLLI
jgi:bacteriorhodopsin